MEVHTPKKTPRSWREFLKDVGIIVLGVLIALTAEQSVQWLHRYQTRQQLEKDLREEMRMNDVTLRDDLQVLSERQDLALHEAHAIQTALKEKNIASLGEHEPKFPRGVFNLPNDSVWQHSRESGTIALLPRDEAEAYTTLFRIRERLTEFANHERDAGFELAIVRRRLAGSLNESPALSQLSPAELNELAAALARRGTAEEYVQRYVNLMLAAQSVLESGSTSQEEITKAGNAVFDQTTSTPTPLPGQTP
jgi:hypothetical protein